MRYIVKVVFVMTFIFNVLSGFAQYRVCDEKDYDGIFAYEFSDDLWSADDMIYRRPSLVQLINDSICYEWGLFVFEYGIGVPKECINEHNNEKIRYYNHSLNDSIHLMLINKETVLLNKDGSEYKLFDIRFHAIFLGFRDMHIRFDGKVIEKNIPCYLVTDFYTIKSIDKIKH